MQLIWVMKSFVFSHCNRLIDIKLVREFVFWVTHTSTFDIRKKVSSIWVFPHRCLCNLSPLENKLSKAYIELQSKVLVAPDTLWLPNVEELFEENSWSSFCNAKQEIAKGGKSSFGNNPFPMGKLWLFPSSVRENERWGGSDKWLKWNSICLLSNWSWQCFLSRSSLAASLFCCRFLFYGLQQIKDRISIAFVRAPPASPLSNNRGKMSPWIPPESENFFPLRSESRTFTTCCHHCCPTLSVFWSPVPQLNSLSIDCSLLCCCIFIYSEPKFPIESVTDLGG